MGAERNFAVQHCVGRRRHDGLAEQGRTLSRVSTAVTQEGQTLYRAAC